MSTRLPSGVTKSRNSRSLLNGNWPRIPQNDGVQEQNARKPRRKSVEPVDRTTLLAGSFSANS